MPTGTSDSTKAKPSSVLSSLTQCQQAPLTFSRLMVLLSPESHSQQPLFSDQSYLFSPYPCHGLGAWLLSPASPACCPLSPELLSPLQPTRPTASSAVFLKCQFSLPGMPAGSRGPPMFCLHGVEVGIK